MPRKRRIEPFAYDGYFHIHPRLKRDLEQPLQGSPKRAKLSKLINTTTMNCSTQAQSTFFSVLPIEIRLYIYRLAFGDRLIHLNVKQSDLVRRRPRYHDSKVHRLVGPLDKSDEWRHEYWEGLADRQWHTAGHTDALLALPLTCRAMYHETIDLLYSQPTFHFSKLSALIAFTSHVPSHRIARIRSLKVFLDLPSVERIIPSTETRGPYFGNIIEHPRTASLYKDWLRIQFSHGRHEKPFRLPVELAKLYLQLWRIIAEFTDLRELSVFAHALTYNLEEIMAPVKYLKAHGLGEKITRLEVIVPFHSRVLGPVSTETIAEGVTLILAEDL